MGVKPTLYSVLGTPPGATVDALHAAYLELAYVLHPDRGGDAERFKALTGAWAVLKDAVRRKEYDGRLRMEGRLNCKFCKGTGYSWGRRLCTTCKGTGIKEEQR